MIRVRGERRTRAFIRIALAVIFILILATVVKTLFILKWQSPLIIERRVKIISPIPESDIVKPSKTPTPTAKPTTPPGAKMQIIKQVQAKEVEDYIEGEASYYSRAGCLGCSASLTMANGETLDDSALTLALTPEEVSRGKRLNDFVTVENVATGDRVKAKVTDTGGFGPLGRVADLSVATRDAINCGHICRVRVIYD